MFETFFEHNVRWTLIQRGVLTGFLAAYEGQFFKASQSLLNTLGADLEQSFTTCGVPKTHQFLENHSKSWKFWSLF